MCLFEWWRRRKELEPVSGDNRSVPMTGRLSSEELNPVGAHVGEDFAAVGD